MGLPIKLRFNKDYNPDIAWIRVVYDDNEL
jgi:hypothetical protein